MKETAPGVLDCKRLTSEKTKQDSGLLFVRIKISPHLTEKQNCRRATPTAPVLAAYYRDKVTFSGKMTG